MRTGDADAVEHVSARVRRILAFKRLTSPIEDREDLEQGIMAEVWQAVNRPGFDFTAGFWGFVEVVTSRRCIDWIRARREPSPVAADFRDGGRNPFERVLDCERAEIASQVLQALEPECRRLIAMRLREGISYKEIAQILDRSEGALRVQFYRCIRSARDIVNRMDPEACLGFGKGGPDEPS